MAINSNNILIGYRGDLGDNSHNNIIIGANNYVIGDHNMIFGNNNKITGSNNVIFGSDLIINGDNHYIIISNIIHKNTDLMLDNDIIYKLLLFNHQNIVHMSIDIIRHIVNYIYNIRLSNGEAISYCTNIIQNALRLRYNIS